MDTKNHTLFGGRELPVKLADGRKAVAFVKQLKIAEYRPALALYHDVVALAIFCTDIRVETKPEEAPNHFEVVSGINAGNLDDESFEAVQVALEEVNAKGFFKTAVRQLKRTAELNQNMPPEIIAVLAQKVSEEIKRVSLAPSAGMPPSSESRT